MTIKAMMMSKSFDKTDFLRDVSEHVMEMVIDTGVHRHIVFHNPGSSIYKFEILTWPGSLCITGDCGTYVFSRVPDMFCFFRRDGEADTLPINPDYWQQKLDSVDRSSGYLEFDPVHFQEMIKREFDDFFESNDDLVHYKDGLWQAIQDDVLCCFDDEFSAYQAVRDFHYIVGDEDFYLHYLLDEGLCQKNTDRFLWCLYAIVWGIKKYDERKSYLIHKKFRASDEDGIWIFQDSPDSATYRTNISGWVDRHGRFWGSNERGARESGATCGRCDSCGSITRKYYRLCDPCAAKNRSLKYAQMDKVVWDRETPIFSQTHDRFFFSEDDLRDYINDNEVSVESLELFLCQPKYLDQIDDDYWSESLPEDGELPDDVQAALDNLNSVIRNSDASVWFKGSQAVIVDGMEQEP